MEISYVAFLRGINVGGNHIVKMDALKKTFESLKFKNVKTLLASGNVLFNVDSSGNTKPDSNTELTVRIEATLEKKFGHKIPVILRSRKELSDLAASNPFKGIDVTPQTRLYITFLSKKPISTLKIPYTAPTKDFKILRVTTGEVISVLTVSPERNSTDLMGVIEKEFGKEVTTRNWNTVLKTLK